MKSMSATQCCDDDVFTVQNKLTIENTISVTAYNRTHVCVALQISQWIIVAENNVVEISLPVRKNGLHKGRSQFRQRYTGSRRAFQGPWPDRCAVRQTAESFFANLHAATICIQMPTQYVALPRAYQFTYLAVTRDSHNQTRRFDPFCELVIVSLGILPVAFAHAGLCL